MQYKQKSNFKLLLLVLSIAAMLVMVGCSTDNDAEKLTFVDSNPQSGSSSVETTLKQIRLEFNKQIAQRQVSLLKDQEKISEITVIIDEKELIITDFSLEADTSYQVNYSVQDNDGNSLSDSINFTTQIDSTLPEIPTAEENETMMQAFYWELGQGDYANNYPEETNLWDLLEARASDLAEVGITSLWLPPANKAWGGSDSVGYDNYDLWDLGEFNQKGSIRTKYGTKSELVAAIDAIHNAGMKAYYDVVFNHRMGAESKESVVLSSNSPDKANETIAAWTVFDFAGRQEYYTQNKWAGLYHDFTWDKSCFDAVDYDDTTGDKGKFLFANKDWGWIYEGGTEDYLMGADVDYSNWSNGEHSFNTNVVDEMKAWGQWVTKDIGFDGFRIDAIKHIDNHFINEWIDYVQSNTSKDLFFVGEAWIEDVSSLQGYIDSVKARNTSNDLSDLNVFDFPLRAKFKALRDGGGNFDMSSLKGAGLVNSSYSNHAVTFVDNHDTSRDESEYGKRPISSYAYQAYAYILTRKDVTPTVYWKDYYQFGMKDGLDKLIEARKYFAYGPAYEVNNNDGDVYSYVREGLADVAGDGLVLMISDGKSGTVVSKNINSRQPNTTFYDYTGNVAGTITTDGTGKADFKVKQSESKGWSVWVPVN